jgi:hypothetical protein
MRRTEALQGVRMMRFSNVFGRWEAAEVSQLEVSELLGVGERTFRRWRDRYGEDREAGLLDRRLGQLRNYGNYGDGAFYCRACRFMEAKY